MGYFTGLQVPPLFDENKIKGKINQKSEVINTTEKLFGPELHRYTIDEAIADGNVLGFNVDYMNTGEFSHYDELRDKLIEKMLEEQPDTEVREVERLVYSLSEAEVEAQAAKKKILIYHDETHIPKVVEEIIKNWEKQSQKRQFNAILTVAYKKRVITYYHEFKKQLKNNELKLNVAMTFSFGNENDSDNVDLKVVNEMFEDYAEFTGIEFVASDTKRGERAYFDDVIERTTRGGSGRNSKNIDLIIVADQLLTGYDSKRLNTLYVDRSLELQGLIQAYSRTNRVFNKTKEFGSIVNFKFPRITEETVNKALELYGSGGKSSLAIVDIYEHAVKKINIKIESLIETLPNPTKWSLLQKEEKAKEAFIKAFKDAYEQLSKVIQYYEYSWNDYTFGLDEHTWMQYLGAYKNLTKTTGPRDPSDIIVNPLLGKTKLAGTQVIDAAHILSLIGSKVESSGGVQAVNEETLRIIYEQIQELSNMGENEQALLLKEFVDQELVLGRLDSQLNFDDAFEAWKKAKMQAEIEELASQWGVNVDVLSKSVSSFSETEPNKIPYIEEIIESVNLYEVKNRETENQLQHILKLNDTLSDSILKIKQKYD